ncbi:ATP-binding cassette domain-containing protein [Maritimibacter sp. UBA3975]|uniref:ATP-binding cassette domain-containing protein n=1 Tax=Maritimibacter sp. UBA3975 TaxID=1946833 RepID=UPI000C0ACF24|nr:ATP-binding cassette domain-containing protein [Maritimibacter sp. UBA3975]MAM63599.1 ABC transporter ATP-binding protein [Maritimibacter sp.]|tara:strand:- start:1173 stop:3422 length:2250 start_codon:yes stop_codon:yes gene_type:complete
MTNTVAFPSITGATVRAAPTSANDTQAPTPRTRIKVKSSEETLAPQGGSARLMRRAELLAVYARLLGAKPLARDIHDAMHALTPGNTVSAEDLVTGLRATGLSAQAVREADPDGLPLIAMMTNGQAVLVLEQHGETLTIYEAGAPDGRTEVALADFAPYYAGVVVRASAQAATLDARHAETTAAPHWFWGELKRYKRHFGDVALGSFVANLLAVSVALFSLQVYDRVIPHQSVPTLWMLALGAGFAILMEAGIKIARARLMDGAGRTIELNVQKLLLGRLLGMRSDKRPTTPSGLFAAMREFSSVREFFTASSIGALTDIPFIFVFLLLVSSIGGSIVLVLIAGGILMVLPGILLQKRMVELSRQSQGASAKTSRLLHEAIYDLDTIKSSRGEARFTRLWDELITLQALKSTEQRKLSALLTFWAQGVQQATYVGAVIVGTYLVFAGQFTVGTIIAVGILSGRTLAPLTQLAATLARWSNVKNALDGLDAIANAEQDEGRGRTLLRRDVIHGAYELREVRFAYDEDMPSLDVAGLAIEAGQHVAVLGANGSGKSTFLKLLAGRYAPVSGRILLDGVDLGRIAPRDLRRNLGYLGQDVRLFAGTLRENLDLTMLERDDERLLDALDFAGLGPFVRGHAKGLDLEIRDNGEGLSAGQRQSIGWARIWLQDPRIVVLDEPTAALDTTLEATLVSRLSTWLDGRTAIIATHRVPILNLTERTVILQNGRLAVDGPRDEVLAHLRDAQSKREAG